MYKTLSLLAIVLMLTSCQSDPTNSKTIITTDISNFWTAYDKITSTQDTLLQYQYLDSLYLQKGSAGLHAIRQARNYTSEDYINAINSYPQFWNSIRENTLMIDQHIVDVENGIEKFKGLYPDFKPVKVYFTIGVFRTGGTAVDSLVLIGSELAMGDSNTVTIEFPNGIREDREAYFLNNPIDNLVLLNVHEYVHTQQKPMVDNLLSYALYEGVAEFVSTKALGVPSDVPAIEFGKNNAEKVRDRFEQDMFYINNTSKWLWSSAPNEFGVRDLGYYIGYQLSENYYEQAENKTDAVKKLIELDYSNDAEVADFIQTAGFFSVSLDSLNNRFENKRPSVIDIKQFDNNTENISSMLKEITITFSEPLNGHNTGVDYGELGEDAFPKVIDRVWATDSKSWTLKVELEPNKEYQFLISDNFRTDNDIPLKPYLIHFKTGK